MNQKGLANIVLAVVVLAIVAVGGYFILSKKSEPVAQQISSFEARKENGKMVLYKVYSDGTSQKSGLEVTLVKAAGTEVPVKIVVSPDKTMAVFNNWNDAGYTTQIYISSVDGSNTKVLVDRSEVGEGQGGIKQNSLAWSSDGKYITYFEAQSTGEGEYAPGSVNTYKATYQVNVATGEKKLISKVPLDYVQ